MKYKKFCKDLKETVTDIANLLSAKKIKFSNSGSEFAIKLKSNKIDSVKDDIDCIVTQKFDCSKASKFREFNSYDGILYLQFKRPVL